MPVDKLTKIECCGCWACVNVCPKKCISMSRDEEWFYYPVVDHEGCVNCGLCLKVCPSKSDNIFNFENVKCYAAINHSDWIRFNSSSGGVFYEIAKYILKRGGVVYGAAFTSEWEVVHVRIDDISKIHETQKSKYLQSNIDNTYKKIKKDLDEGLTVLFSGTPCQVLALKNIPLSKLSYKKLICIDIACHGVPSEKSWYYYLKSINVDRKQISSLDFRDKKFPWHNYTLTIKTKEGFTLSESCDKNPFMLGFIYNLTNRPSCHNCPAKELRSGSDIMLADFWGVEEVLPKIDDNKGVSLIIIKTEVGNHILKDIGSNFKLITVSNETFTKRNSTFIVSSKPHYKRDYFFHHLGEIDYDELVKKSIQHNAPFYKRILRRIKMLLEG